MKKWNKLPEWSRWILCWPLILLLAFLTGIVIRYFVFNLLSDSILPDSVAKAIAPSLQTLIVCPLFFFFIHLLVPRKPTWITGFFVFLGTILGLLIAIRLCVEIWSEQFEAGPFFRDALQTITYVVISWSSFFYFKDEFREKRAVSA